MIGKMLEVAKDRNVQLALFIGMVVPKLSYFIVKKICQKVHSKRDESQIGVGIELGGTNYSIAIGSPVLNKNGEVIDFKLIKRDSGRTTNNAYETLQEIVDKIMNCLEEGHKIHFIGISSFGPLELNKKKETFGSITSTPKEGWKNTSLIDFFKTKLQCENISIQTDVNAAAFAEFTLGHHEAKESVAYVTVGTGVGVGVVAHKKTIHGLTHPEGGHILQKSDYFRVNRHAEEYEDFQGVCPFHKSCLEGMVANRSISQRTKVDFIKLHQIEDNEKIWDIIGFYLAQLCLNITLTVSPQKIIIGGGIMNRKILYDYIRKHFLVLLANYVEHTRFTEEGVKQYIVAPHLGSSVGVKSALLLKYL